MKDLENLYQEYGEYNVLYNQLNMPSPSIEYAWRKTKKIVQDEVLGIIGGASGKLSIGDVGCGNGALMIRLAELSRDVGTQLKFTGFDISKPFIDYGRMAAKYKKLTNIDFEQLNIEKEELPGDFDVIICSEVLEHVKKPELMLEKLYLSLHSGGYLVLTTPNSKNLIKYPFLFLKKGVSQRDSQEMSKFLTKAEQKHKLAELEQHLYVFSQPELKELLRKVGFGVVKTPRSTTLFGGPFLDNHSLLLATIMITDTLFDLLPFPQIGWDNIFVCKK